MAAFSRFRAGRGDEEFPRAREASLDYIEWIHDEYGRTTKRSGRKMPTMCAGVDYLKLKTYNNGRDGQI